MIDRVGLSTTVRIVLPLSCFLAAGCAGVERAQTTEPAPVAPPAAPVVVVEPPAEIVPAAVAAPEAAQAPDAQRATAPSPSAIQPARPVKPAPVPRVAAPKVAAPTASVTPPVVPSRQQPMPAVAAEPVPASPTVPKVAAAPAAAAPLDLNLLETRLRETKAIGVFTKLSIKNQVDDLLDKFRAYHKRQGTATLVELRRNYDMLMLKVLVLLQDSDPSLARDVVKSRAAIWSILADPRKFTESKLMAGATS
jgi:hypothetical protein